MKTIRRLIHREALGAVTFVTVMPLVRTSAGMRPSAELTRFCTSTAARSWSREMSKVTVIVETPELVLDDCM